MSEAQKTEAQEPRYADVVHHANVNPSLSYVARKTGLTYPEAERLMELALKRGDLVRGDYAGRRLVNHVDDHTKALQARIAELEAWQEDVRSNSPLLARLERAELRVKELEVELVAEAARTAEQKLRADQMTQQHATQAALNKEAREQLAKQAASAAEVKEAAARLLVAAGCVLRYPKSGAQLLALENYSRNMQAVFDSQKCPTCNDNGMIGGPSFYAPDEGGDSCPDCAAPPELPRPALACHCEACDIAANGMRLRMSLCPQCGDKRCPRAAHHNNQCAKTGATN